MILNIRIFARATAPLGLILLTLSACGGPEQDAFEVAKAHVWGDKYNGCEYQTIHFTANEVVFSNSKQRISQLAALSKGATGKEMSLPNKMSTEIAYVEVGANEFRIYDRHKASGAKFSLDGRELIFEAGFIDGKWENIPRKKGIGNQSTYILCE